MNGLSPSKGPGTTKAFDLTPTDRGQLLARACQQASGWSASGSYSDIPSVERALWTNHPAIKASVIVSVLIVAALVTLTPNGRSPETLPIVGLVTALLMSITGGFAYSSSLLENSNEIYARWLESR